MIFAFDTHYFADKAQTACVAFTHWDDREPGEVHTEVLEGVAGYQPGRFYLRELPCILSLMEALGMPTAECILVDGFVYLDDAGTPGLGARLHDQLGGKVPVIGVAKTHFATIHALNRELRRGNSQRPLYITAIGVPVEEAVAHVAAMHGPHRIPHLLKLADTLSRQHP